MFYFLFTSVKALPGIVGSKCYAIYTNLDGNKVGICPRWQVCHNVQQFNNSNYTRLIFMSVVSCICVLCSRLSFYFIFLYRFYETVKFVDNNLIPSGRWWSKAKPFLVYGSLAECVIELFALVNIYTMATATQRWLRST